jgi:glycosyltransferase involved in cell wall biosynthesis
MGEDSIPYRAARYRYPSRGELAECGDLAVKVDDFPHPGHAAPSSVDNLKLRFSVVIPTHNRAVHLEKAVRSVLDQTVPAHEIIVVDDGSTDDTSKVVDAMIRTGAPLRYLSQTNQGPAAARNGGIRAASGDWIALLDSDDMWLPHKLETASIMIADAPDVDFIHSRSVHDFELTAGDLPEPLMTVEQRCDPAALMKGWNIKTSSVAIRRTLLDSLDDLFPTDLQTCEDYELFWRAVTAARRIAFAGVPDTVIANTPTSLSRDERRVLPRMMDNIEAMSRVIRWLDARPEGDRLKPILEGRRYWAARNLLTRAAREGCLFKMLRWLPHHGLARKDIGRALCSACRGVVNGENPSGV